MQAHDNMIHASNRRGTTYDRIAIVAVALASSGYATKSEALPLLPVEYRFALLGGILLFSLGPSISLIGLADRAKSIPAIALYSLLVAGLPLAATVLGVVELVRGDHDLAGMLFIYGLPVVILVLRRITVLSSLGSAASKIEQCPPVRST